MTDDEVRARIPALASAGAAVITGAASGIGLAAAKRFAALGLTPVLADVNGEALQAAARDISGAICVQADVANAGDLDKLRQAAAPAGRVAVLMNNAGAMFNPGSCFAKPDEWRRLIDINLFGVINGVQAFAPAMIAHGAPALIINTGSKQGITTPPGNAAYNVSKAALKAYTEALAHELRGVEGAKVSAHLLIPGFTHTGMTSGGRGEKPAAAWTPEQVVDFLLESVARGDFYILCPDNDVTRAMDEKRMQWAIDDIIKNRPALSRWHPDYAAAFADFMKG